jgi:hypothetical protein
VATVTMGIFGALSLAALVIFRKRWVPGWVAVSGLVGTVALSALMGWTANLGGRFAKRKFEARTHSRAVASRTTRRPPVRRAACVSERDPLLECGCHLRAACA